MANLHYFTRNYVNDFMETEMQAVVWQAYDMLGNLLWDLGVRESEEKAVPPLQIVEFLGTGFNLIRQILFIPPEK